MSLLPLIGFVEGDTIGVLVLAEGDTSIAEVCDKLRSSVSVRVDPAGPWTLAHGARTLHPQDTVRSAGLGALDRVDLRRPR